MTGKKSGYCPYCDIGTEFLLHEPAFFGRWVEDHVRRYGSFGKVFMVDYADEASGAGIAWWQAVEDRMPAGLTPHEDFGVRVYIKPGRGFFDSEDIARVLWRVGVEDIHVGFEAATNRDLRSLRKGARREDHETVIRIAKKFNFRIIASFVLGAPTATQASLMECVRFAEWMADEIGDKAIVVMGSPLIPFPGAPVWTMLRRKAEKEGVHHDLFQTDNPDLYLARRLWYQWFCKDLCAECGGVDEALAFVKKVCDRLSAFCTLPGTGFKPVEHKNPLQRKS